MRVRAFLLLKADNLLLFHSFSLWHRQYNSCCSARLRRRDVITSVLVVMAVFQCCTYAETGWGRLLPRYIKDTYSPSVLVAHFSIHLLLFWRFWMLRSLLLSYQRSLPLYTTSIILDFSLAQQSFFCCGAHCEPEESLSPDPELAELTEAADGWVGLRRHAGAVAVYCSIVYCHSAVLLNDLFKEVLVRLLSHVHALFLLPQIESNYVETLLFTGKNSTEMFCISDFF